jgi:hypothetical protein
VLLWLAKNAPKEVKFFWSIKICAKFKKIEKSEKNRRKPLDKPPFGL